MSKSAYLITDYGAKPDTDELQTKEIQSAIDACFLNGGGEVIVPAGTFLTGAVRIRSNVTLRLKSGAVIKGSRNVDDYYGASVNDNVEPLDEDDISDELYGPDARDRINRDCEPTEGAGVYDFYRKPATRWNHGLIIGIHAVNIAIIGEKDSVFDGSNVFDELGEERYRGPHCIFLHKCENVRLDGYTVTNSSNWAHNIIYSKNVSCKNLTVLAGHDGIHITACENVTLDDCEFYTGDDCIAGLGNVNVTARNCLLNTACNAFRFGATNAYIEKCKAYGPGKYVFRGSLTPEEKRNCVDSELFDPNAKEQKHRFNLLSFFDYYADYSVHMDTPPSNIVISDCTVDNSMRLIIYNFNAPFQKNRPLESITFRNIKATKLEIPLIAIGSQDVPIQLNLENVKLELSDKYTDDSLILTKNFGKISLKDVTVTGGKLSSLVKKADGVEGQISFENVRADVKEENRITNATEEFKIAFC